MIAFLKGLCADSVTLGPSTKAAVWKMPRPQVKENYLLILKRLLEGQEPVVILAGEEGAGGGAFLFSPSKPASISEHAPLLNTTNVPHSNAPSSCRSHSPCQSQEVCRGHRGNTVLEYLALVRLCFWVPWVWNIWTESSWQATIPR